MIHSYETFMFARDQSNNTILNKINLYDYIVQISSQYENAYKSYKIFTGNTYLVRN